MTPLVSAVIPAYNSGKYIGECLDSLIAQTYPHWEAIVVLAPSDDNTLDEIVSRMDDQRIRLTIEPSKTTCASARNTGFDRCAGNYVAFLDADDWWDAGKLKMMVSVMEYEGPSVKWGSHYLVTHRDGKELYGRCHPGDSHDIIGISTVVFRKTYLNSIKERWGYVFYPPMPKGDDGDLCLRIINDPSVCIPIHLGHWRWNDTGLTANTSLFESLRMTLGMAYRNRAYSILPYYFWNLSLQKAGAVLGCDLVQFKRRVVNAVRK